MKRINRIDDPNPSATLSDVEALECLEGRKDLRHLADDHLWIPQNSPIEFMPGKR